MEQLDLSWNHSPAGPLAETAGKRLAACLGLKIGARVALSITDNRVSLIHARYLQRQPETVLSLRLHHMFLDAPPSIVDALACYLANPGTSPRRKNAAAAIDLFVQRNQGKVRGASRASTQSRRPTHRSKVHNLDTLFRALNASYFDDAVTARVVWGRRGQPSRRGRTQSLRLGVYLYADDLIRLHPVLDQPWVPDYFVRFVLFHEMLHAVVPPEQQGRRRCYHSKTFRARERAYPDYQKALAWEKANLGRLLATRGETASP